MAAVPDPRGSRGAAGPPFGFTDVQLAVPTAAGSTHTGSRVEGGTEIYDHVQYQLPFEPLASALAAAAVRRWLTAIFDYRADQIEARLR